ncbi:MAG: MmcQ/YjbR family DNA-binding protein [Bacteroidales bacterium]|jgi:predicted DNA-binding protein (MmcQ/YjbR family)|nr:MmcQ/YjbR family DNA-binding protein [Bacteroidales bacterium]
MNIEELREFCLSVKGASESMPFDDNTLVFKVMGKIFALVALEQKDGGRWLNLKCDPQKSIELRERYAYIKQGWHMNGLYWNTVYFEMGMPDKQLKELILHSKDEVIKKLPKKKQEEYNQMK